MLQFEIEYALTMLTELRKDAWGKTCLVIVLTNYIDQEKQQAAAEAGVTEYWPKADLSLETIVARVKTALAA